MNTEFAVCGENQSGQRFLGSSDPRLIRQVAACNAAGGGFPTLPAGKDQKLLREFEGGALIGAEGTVPYSLDSITNNRHTAEPDCYSRPLGRGKYCGKWSIRGNDPKTKRTVLRRVNCGGWTCSYCGPRKAKQARKRIREIAEQMDMRVFLTLTLDPKKLKSRADAVRHLRKVFNKFREYLRRKYGVPPRYICVLEFTVRGVPHLHVLLDRFIPQKWISRTWARLGGGRMVHIKQVQVHHVARYLSKYLTKDLILSAPRRSRRITTARGIKLFPKFDSGITWEFLRQSIWYLLAQHNADVSELQLDMFRCILLHYDEEKYLKSFELAEDG